MTSSLAHCVFVVVIPCMAVIGVVGRSLPFCTLRHVIGPLSNTVLTTNYREWNRELAVETTNGFEVLTLQLSTLCIALQMLAFDDLSDSSSIPRQISI